MSINIKSELSHILALMLLFTSLGVGTTFAAENTPKAVSDLKSNYGYKAVLLNWSPVSGAKKYCIYKKNPGSSSYVKAGETSGTSFRATGIEHYKTYYFYVTAYAGSKASPKSNVVSGTCIRDMTYTLKIKRGGTLKSHGGSKTTYRLKKGQTIVATGFSGGKYMFRNGNRVYYCAKTRTASRKANYTTQFNYSKASAEDLANNGKLTSKTNKMIWVSTYTQHVYYFVKNKSGKWELKDNWECSTGKAGSPTPTGLTGRKTIWKKIKTRHGLKWWSPFSSMNAMHGKQKSWKLGIPGSGGCVRNPNEKAKFVYQNCGIGTRVLIF